MTKDEVKLRQKYLNSLGADLTVDGIIGPKTLAAEAKYGKPLPVPVVTPKGFFGAPWINVDLDLLGVSETNAELTKRLAPHWKNVGLPGYVKKGLSGSDRAWCALRVHYALAKVGIATEKLNAGAYSLSNYGVKSPFWFGALTDIKHGKNGGRHAAFFLYWIDEKKKLAATLDGNRSNKFAVFATDLSGRGDFLVNGPRFPKGMTGQFVTKEEVLKAYPYLKVGGTGNSTR